MTTAERVEKYPNATTAGLSGALCTIGFYIGSTFGWEPPAEVAAAIVTVVSTLVVGIRPWFNHRINHNH